MRITAEDLRKSYGEVTALDGLSLEVPSGTTFGVLGTNGAGKTTLFETLIGLERPDGGRLTVGPHDATAAGTSLREHVGYLPERVGFPSALTGREVLAFQSRMRSVSAGGRIPEVLETVGLSESAADRAVSGYSNGMRRRLGLAGALLARPSVLVLDEPTAGLDPRGVAEFHRTVERVRERTDATVVLSSHVLPEVERLCDRVAVLHEGRVVVEGPVEELAGSGGTAVELRPADPGEVNTLLEVADGVADARAVDGSVEVRCDPDDLPSLFAALEDRVDLADVSVGHDGLAAAFHEAVPGEVDA